MAIDADPEPSPAPAQRVLVALAAPSARGVARLMAIVAACAAALYLVYLTRGVIELCAIAGFVAIALAPVVDAAQRATRLSRAWAIGAVYVACALAIVGVSALIVPSVGSQVRELSRSAQRAVEDLRSNPTVRRYDDRYHLAEKTRAQLQHLPEHIDEAAGPLRDVTVGAVAFASHLVAVLSIAFLLILHADRYAHAALGALPPAQAARWRRVGPSIYRAVSGYVLGNLAISVIAGTCAWLALTILAVLVGAALLGLLGALLAIPAAAALQLILRDLRDPAALA